MYPHTSYIIYATPRSGSTLLCEALRKTGVAGRPGEYFTAPHAQGYSMRWDIPLRDSTEHLGEDYFRRIYATATPNGVFGVKILWLALPYCLEQIRKLEGNEMLSTSELLSTAFTNHRVIMTTRRDKLRQAISWWRAGETHIWRKHSKNPKSLIEKALYFDFHTVENYRQQLISSEQKMQAYFLTSNIQPFTVVYEDFVTAYEETILQLLDYLHIPAPKDLALGEPLLQKQADEQTEMWVQQYYQTKQKQGTIAI